MRMGLAALVAGQGLPAIYQYREFAAAGGVLPRTLPDASRPALLGASLVGVALGALGLFLGTPR